MEKQYIVFRTAKAFWFLAFCGLLMFFLIIFLAVYIKPQLWQVAIIVFVFSGAVTFSAFKIDSKTKSSNSGKP